MEKRNECLIIIPAYNEAESIDKVIDNIIENYPQYDYVVVNDGSTDDTRKICAARGYNLLDLPENAGLSGAIKSGIRYANFNQYDMAIQIDGDGQHDPKYIADMIAKMKDCDADIVIGSRFVKKAKDKSLRMVGSKLIGFAIKITTGKRISDATSGMRLFNKRMIKRFGYQMNYGPEPDTIAYLINCGAKIEEVQVEMYERTAGQSYLTLTRSARYMLNVLYGILVFQWFRKKEKI